MRPEGEIISLESASTGRVDEQWRPGQRAGLVGPGRCFTQGTSCGCGQWKRQEDGGGQET